MPRVLQVKVVSSCEEGKRRVGKMLQTTDPAGFRPKIRPPGQILRCHPQSVIAPARQPARHPRIPTGIPTPVPYLYRAQLDQRLDRFAFLRIAAAQAAVRQRACGETRVPGGPS